MKIIDRSKKPEENGSVKFELPQISRFKIDGKAEALFVKKEDLPIVKMSFIFDSGSKTDPGGKKGLAFLSAMLIDEGAGPYDALQLSDEFEFLGSSLSINVTEDSIIFSILSLKEYFEKTLELLSFIIKDPHLKQTEFDRERKSHLTKLLQLQNQPDFTASSIFQNKILLGTPYEHSPFGIYEQVVSLTLEDVKKFCADKLKCPSIAVVGNIEQEALLKMFDKYFQNVFTSSELPGSIYRTSDYGKSIFLYDKRDSAQAEIRLGHDSNVRESDFFSKLLLNSALGGQFSSRLIHNLREEKGYTYGIHSSFGYNKCLGSFEIGTAIEIKNALPAVLEIIKEIEGIKEGITPEELAFSKAYLTKRFPAQFETYSNILTNLNSLLINNLPLDYYDNYLNNIRGVELNDISATAKNRIDLDRMQIVIVGDTKATAAVKNEIPGYSVFEVDKNGTVLREIT